MNCPKQKVLSKVKVTVIVRRILRIEVTPLIQFEANPPILQVTSRQREQLFLFVFFLFTNE